MRITSLLTFAACALTAHAGQFEESWYDGNAEISTYQLREMRYGQIRSGVRIMVFVTEPMRLAAHIKPDQHLPDSLAAKVLKLNDIRKFTTGIYDYSVMTSAFSLAQARPSLPLWSPMKVAFTGQEWCGTVFERSVRDSNSWRGTLYSYFESEGEQEWSLPLAGEAMPEENLWIVVRELKGPSIPVGKPQDIAIIPSAWSRRKAHESVSIVRGQLLKGPEESLVTGLGKVSAVKFSWTAGTNVTQVWVEKEWPRRILAWKEPDSSAGQILASRREQYWSRNGIQDEYLRESLRLGLSDKAQRPAGARWCPF